MGGEMVILLTPGIAYADDTPPRSDWHDYRHALEAVAAAPDPVFARTPPEAGIPWATMSRVLLGGQRSCEQLTTHPEDEQDCVSRLGDLRASVDRALAQGAWFESALTVRVGAFDPMSRTFPLLTRAVAGAPEGGRTCELSMTGDGGVCLFSERPPRPEDGPLTGMAAQQSEIFSPEVAPLVWEAASGTSQPATALFWWSWAPERCDLTGAAPHCWGAGPGGVTVAWPFAVRDAQRLQAISRLSAFIQRGVDVAAGSVSAGGGASTDAWLVGQMAEMHHRLGEYFADEADAMQFEEEGRSYDVCVATPGCDTNQLTVDHALSRDWRVWALEAWGTVIDRYPRYPAVDEVLYAKAGLLSEMGEKEQARALFEALVRDHPTSRFASMTYLRLGGIHYEQGSVRQALLSWLKASGDARFDGWDEGHPAVRAAICYAELGDLGRAIQLLQGVVDRMRSATDATVRVGPIVDTLGALYADADRGDEGLTWFDTTGSPALAREGAMAIALRFAAQGRRFEADAAFQRALDHAGVDPVLPDIWAAKIQFLDEMGDHEGALDELVWFAQALAPGSAWSAAHAADSGATLDARRRIQTSIGAFAARHYDAGQAHTRKRYPSKALTEYRLAERAWIQFTDLYPDAPETAVVHYNLGELWYSELDEPARALAAYDRALALGLADHPDHLEESARGAVYAAHDVLQATAGGSPEAVRAAQDALILVVERYASLYPDNQEEVGKSVLLVADLLAERSDLHRAGQAYLRVIQIAPRSAVAVNALQGVMSVLSEQGDWGGARDIASGVAKSNTSSALRSRAQGYLDQAEYMIREERCTQAAAPEACVAAFQEYLGLFPEGPERQRALRQLAVHAHAANLLPDAIAAREDLVRSFPHTPGGDESLRLLGSLYAQIGRFEEAAAAYVRFARERPADADAEDALREAARLYVALGDPHHAMQNLGWLLDRRPPPTDSDDLRLRLAALEAADGRTNAAMTRLSEIFERKKGPLATYTDHLSARWQHYQLSAASGARADLSRLVSEAIRYHATARPPDGGDLRIADAAAAEFLLIEAHYAHAAYAALGISGPPPGTSLPRDRMDRLLKQQLLDKTRALVALERAYARVVKTGGTAPGLQAFLGLARAHEEMAAAIEASHVPSYLTDDQRELYRYGLEDAAYNQRDKAAGYYRELLTEAFAAGFHGEETREANRRLSHLQPEEHPPRFEILPRATKAAPADGSDFETDP